MIYPLYGPIAASPLLFLTLQKIARTPTARLSIVYQLIDRTPCPAPPYVNCGCGVADVACNGDKNLRPIAQNLYLDRLLAGGIQGEFLPISRVHLGCDTRPLANVCLDWAQDAPLGANLDLCA